MDVRAENEEQTMSKFPKLDATVLCGPASADDSSFFIAVIGVIAKNIEALSDSIIAVLYGDGEAYSHLAYSATEILGHRIDAAAALAAARTPSDVFAAQQEFARRAIETYAATARNLGAAVTAGAKACREPLLERLR
jgi:hypothetical protein